MDYTRDGGGGGIRDVITLSARCILTNNATCFRDNNYRDYRKACPHFVSIKTLASGIESPNHNKIAFYHAIISGKPHPAEYTQTANHLLISTTSRGLW